MIEEIKYNDYRFIKETVLVDEIRSTLKIISNLMSIPLFLAFWIADILLYPDMKWEFLGLRLLIIPICFLTLRFINIITNYTQAQALASAYAIASATVINIMIFQIQDAATPYYAGLNLVATAGLSFLPLNRKYLTLTALGIYGPYFAAILYNHEHITNLRAVILNIFFITGAIVICTLIRYFNGKLRLKDLDSQNKLADELHSREQVIIQKTKEATKLHQLSAQFSPQVVKAIKDGQISIDEGVQRAKICAIFIDIVRSTDKVTTLPENNVQLCLARFLDTCLTTFLKYDLTIDKFHGDGILAFSNMPIPREDYIERTCMAALEAVSAIKNDKEFYTKYWQSELEVRVGISAGQANVGFYGNKKYFKTFTAIGTPLPYASRLTSIAEPGQILIDGDMAAHLEKVGFVMKNYGLKTLKGFENNKNCIFELISSPNTVLKGENTKTCPQHSNSVLYLDTNTDGHFVFKCRECAYEESQINAIDLQSSSKLKAAS